MMPASSRRFSRSQSGVGGEVDAAGEVGLGDAALGGEDGEDLQVAVVELQHQVRVRVPTPAARAAASAWVAMAVSWAPVPVRSQTVIGVGRRAAGDGAGDDGAELGRGAAGPVAGGERGAELAEGLGLGGAVADVEVGGGEDAPGRARSSRTGRSPWR